MRAADNPARLQAARDRAGDLRGIHRIGTPAGAGDRSDPVAFLFGRHLPMKWGGNQNLRLPVTVSKKSRKSPIRLHSGYLNVAGRFFSKKKCPTQAKP